MRYAWIAFVLILLDQSIKWILHATGIDTRVLFEAGPVTLQLLKSNWLEQEVIYGKLANSTTIILLLALLIIHLLISRWSTASYFITRKTKLGMQSASAGIISYVADNIFSGGIRSTLRLEVADTFTINAGIADLALLLGFTLLMLALYQGGSKIRCKMTLLPSDIAPLRFSHMPRGVDNVHIDVLLSPDFRKLGSRVVHTLVPLVIRHLLKNRQTIVVPKNQLANFTQQFNILLETSLHLAKTRGDKQLPNLFYIAAQKYIHNEVTNTVAATIQRKKESVQERNRRGLGTQNDIRLVEWMFRYRERIIATTNLTLLNALGEGRNRTADKAIETVLGKRDVFIQQARRAWLVKAESSADEFLLMNYYVTLGPQQEDRNSFLNVDKLLSDVFRGLIPLLQTDPDKEKSDKHLSRDSDTLSQPSVLMNPRNITILLDTGWTRSKLKRYSPLRDWKHHRQYRQHLEFQRRLALKLVNALHKSGLGPWINAAYETRGLLRKINAPISPGTLNALLVKQSSRSDFNQRLEELLKGGEGPLSAKAITSAWERIHKHGGELLRCNLLHFIRDFSRYRHDLAMLFTYQRAAAQLSLLNNEKDIQTSRANFSLYEFLCPSERRQADAPILSHIIIKADLRGSTDITQKLTELELNPATHFDRNFFSPINDLIETYGAEKVFIEGDAIILILNERQGDTEGRLIACHACGLAAKILQVVAKQNQELSAYGLPKLELGIGIAHCDEAPRYLFDQQHRITISPAINRADRLSACAWGVRNWREQQNAPPTHVEVYQPSEKEMSHGEKAQKDLVYNLNGVLIEGDVFTRLQQEITPKPLYNPLEQYAESDLYGIEFPDMSGGIHHLIIRMAPVKIYDPDNRVEECPIVEARYFYEVLYEKELVQQVQQATG